MSKIIKNGSVVEDNWVVVPKDAAGLQTELSQAPAIVPLSYWLVNRESLLERAQQGTVGVWIDSDEEIETLSEDINQLPLLAVNFPGFMDGRSFSTSRLAKERYGFKGEVRAIGNFIRDQLFYLKRCGVDTFQSESLDLEEAKASLSDFSDVYQAAIDQPRPLFLRR